MKLAQVFNILIENAVKYSYKYGKVEVSCTI